MERIEEPIKILFSVQVPPTMAQVTKAQVGQDVVYIRENVRDGKQILELLAPEHAWAKIAAIILVEDDQKRGIFKNEEFTEAWVRGLFGKE